MAVTGVAGGLGPVGTGDVVVADRVISPDGVTVATLPPPTLLAEALRRAGLRVVVGPIVTVDRLADAAAKQVLAATGAVAVDMESATLVAQPWRVPVAVVRAVSDAPEHQLWSAATLAGGVRALRSLRAAAPVLEAWAAAAGPRKVILASPRSFCAGVERAIDTVAAALDRFGAPVYVRRQIVHNEYVVAGLEARGAVFVSELDAVPDGATVVFSAHGVGAAVRAEAEAKQLRVVDATCPLVAKVHSEVRRFAERGFDVVLIGHAGHDEVEGTRGELPGIHVVGGPDDVAGLDVSDGSRVAYATQTTLSPADVAPTVEALRARFPGLVGPRASDICYATHNRQEAVSALAGHVELVLVVGSTGSSNSRRLVEVARRAGARAELVADETGLQLEWLAGAGTVAVTAGASTPEVLVHQVVDALGGLGPLRVDEQTGRHESVSFSLPPEVR